MAKMSSEASEAISDAVLSASRVENWRGGGRYRGLTVAGGFRRLLVSQSDP